MTQPTALSADELRDFVVGTIERVWNANDWSAAGKTYAEDVIVHVPFQDEPLRGREALRGFHEELHRAFPDWHATIDSAVTDGDCVAMQWTIRGTHLGSFIGIPPTGNAFLTNEAVFVRVGPDGLGLEIWFYLNMAGLMSQLGLAPSGPPPRVLILAMVALQRLRRRWPGVKAAAARRARRLGGRRARRRARGSGSRKR